MTLDASRWGTAVKDELKAAGLLNLSREVEELTVDVGAVATYTLDVEDGASTWSVSVSFDSPNTSKADIADGLAGQLAADPILSSLLEISSDGVDTVTITALNPGQSFNFTPGANLSSAAGTPDEDASAEADVESFWQEVAAANITEVSTNARIGALEVDLDPTDGSREGELLPATGQIS